MSSGEHRGGSVVGHWLTITDFLGRHCPDVVAQIRPPATSDLLRRAEEAVGVPLPTDLSQWWQLADGMDGHSGLIPQGHTPLSVEAALRSRMTWMTVTADSTHYAPDDYERSVSALAGTPCDFMWLPQWLPIAADGGGTDLFVDLRPGPAHGSVGEYYSDAWAFAGPTWDSVTAMLTDVGDAMLTDKLVRGFRLWTDEEGVSWDLDAWRWAQGGSTEIDPQRLRQRYADLVSELHAGGFGAPSDGGWTAETIAAHVKRNTELLVATTDEIAATSPDFDRRMAEAQHAQRVAQAYGRTAAHVEPTIRYDNREAMNPAVLTAYASVGLAALADDIEQLSERLLDSARRLNGRRPSAYAHIVDGETLIADERVGWWGVLWALCLRQLPRRLRQLQRLRHTL